MICPYCCLEIQNSPGFCPQCGYNFTYNKSIAITKPLDNDFTNTYIVTNEQLTNIKKSMKLGLISGALFPASLPVFGCLISLLLNYRIMKSMYDLLASFCHPKHLKLKLLIKQNIKMQIMMFLSYALFLIPNFLTMLILVLIWFGYLIFLVHMYFNWKIFNALIDDLIDNKAPI